MCHAFHFPCFVLSFEVENENVLSFQNNINWDIEMEQEQRAKPTIGGFDASNFRPRKTCVAYPYSMVFHKKMFQHTHVVCGVENWVRLILVEILSNTQLVTLCEQTRESACVYVWERKPYIKLAH